MKRWELVEALLKFPSEMEVWVMYDSAVRMPVDKLIHDKEYDYIVLSDSEESYR